MNYEDGIKELEEIIYKLEDGNTKFDEATKLFERGAEICKELSKKLEETKGKITIIRETLGSLIEEDLN